MKSLSCLILAIIATGNVHACLQGYHLPPKAPKVPLDPPEGFKPTRPSDITEGYTIHIPAPTFEAPPHFLYGIDEEQKKAYQNLVDQAGNVPAEKLSYEEKIDRAVARIYLAQYAPAISELTELEKERQTYVAASALGTAFELSGDLPRAKKWIEEGIKRNKDGHNGSEWLHVAIIQTKIELRTDKKWLEQHSVIDGQPSLTDSEILHAIEYQLNERLSFITSDDPVVADLFFCAARRSDSPWKKDYYFNQSLRFGKLRSVQIKKERFS